MHVIERRHGVAGLSACHKSSNIGYFEPQKCRRGGWEGGDGGGVH